MQALATSLEYVRRAFSGQGESYGQYIPIHNCTPFTVQLDGKPEVQSGKELTTPPSLTSQTHLWMWVCACETRPHPQ